MDSLALCGFYGYKNYGDTLMLRAIKGFFKNLDIQVSAFSDRKSDEAFYFKENDLLSNVINSYKYIALGGGGIISPNFWFFKNNFHKKLESDNLYLLNVNLTTEAEPILKEIGGKIKLAIVRDKYSAEYAKQFISEDKVIQTSDITLTLPSPQKQDDFAKKKAAVCLNYYIFKNFFSQNHRERIFAEKALIEIAAFLDYLHQQGYKITLVPCQTDLHVNDNIIHGVLKGFAKCNLHWEYSSKNIESLILESNLVISARYHSSLFALKTGTKFIDITHHSKNANFLQEAGLSDFSINYWNLELNSIKNTFKKVCEFEGLEKISAKYGVCCIEEWNTTIASLFTKSDQ